jgi:hypothetical protein
MDIITARAWSLHNEAFSSVCHYNVCITLRVAHKSLSTTVRNIFLNRHILIWIKIQFKVKVEVGVVVFAVGATKKNWFSFSWKFGIRIFFLPAHVEVMC